MLGKKMSMIADENLFLQLSRQELCGAFSLKGAHRSVRQGEGSPSKAACHAPHNPGSVSCDGLQG